MSKRNNCFLLTLYVIGNTLILMKIALTGGGTLGHVIPCLSVMDTLKEIDPNINFFYIGSEKENEKALVTDRGIKYYSVKTGKLRRYFSLKNFVDCFLIIIGFFQSYKILRKERPDVLFSKGGFVSVPPVIAAHLLKIRCITHESDRSIGLANKINSRFCECVCLGFKNENLKPPKYVYTGNPIRRDIKNLKRVKGERKLILVLGGSQGAVEINELIYKNLDKLLEYADVYHQAGRFLDKTIKREGYYQTEFIGSEFKDVLARATLVISRSGANALSELISVHIPMYLIPLSLNASRGDQIENSKWAESNACAIVMKDKEAFLKDICSIITNDELLAKLEEAAKRLDDRDGSMEICKVILRKE